MLYRALELDEFFGMTYAMKNGYEAGMLGVCTGKPHWKQQQVTWQSIASIY
jgi:hypothetical protein